MLSLLTSLPAMLLYPGSSADPIRFLIGFLIACCVIACVIILVRWLLSLTGIAVPQPLMLVFGIILFIFFMLWVLNWAGVYRW